MRKIICIVLAVCTVFLASCKGEGMQEEYLNDRYFYETVYLEDSGYGVIVEFDAVTKSARIPCPDPLCDHGKDCLVSHTRSSVNTSKNRAYFNSGGALYVLDSAKTKISKLFDLKNCTPYGPYQGIGSAVYFTVQEYEYSDTWEILGTVYNIYRYDEQKEKLTLLTSEPLRENVTFYGCKGDRIIWYFTSERAYYSVDADFQNRQPYSLPTEETVFVPERGNAPHSGVAFDLYKINQGGGEKTPVCQKASSYRFADNSSKDAIFYCPTNLVQTGVNEETGEPIFSYRPVTGKLIYKSVTGKEDGYVYELPEGEGILTAFMYTENERNAGAYVAFPYSRAYTDDDGRKHRRGGIFVVNTETKESFSIVFGDENTRVIY